MSSPIEKMLDGVDFKKVNSTPNKEGLPYVTHEGILNIMDIEITVCQLSNGQRIIPEAELNKLL